MPTAEYTINNKLMMLAAGHGSVLKITTDGPQAEEALAALGELIARDFEGS